MSQHDYSIANDTGANVRADLNNLAAAAATNNAGSSAPSTTYAHMWWADETNGVLKQRNAANTNWIIRAPLAATLVETKSSAYTLAVSDYGRTLLLSGTWTLSVTAVATLADGWHVELVNTGTGVVTIDPNASETIDGATTMVLTPGERCRIRCSGSALYSASKNAVRRFFADKNATDQTTVSTATKVTFGTERYDRGGIYDAANSQITGVEGRLSGAAAIFYSAGIVDQVQFGLALWKNGTLHRQLAVVTASGTGTLVVSGTFQEESVASDTWEIRTVFGGGGTVTIGGATTSSYFFAEAA
jgi:hypothetical protein